MFRLRMQEEDIECKKNWGIKSSTQENPPANKKTKKCNQRANAWTMEQDDALRAAVLEYGHRNWKAIAVKVPGRDHSQCLQRWNKVLKPGLIKGPWSPSEDEDLQRVVLQGCDAWTEVAERIPGRTAKQCRERWRNYLDPQIRKDSFTLEEDANLQVSFSRLGNRWTQIAALLPGRTEESVKIRWKQLNPDFKLKTKVGRPRRIEDKIDTEDSLFVTTPGTEKKSAVKKHHSASHERTEKGRGVNGFKEELPSTQSILPKEPTQVVKDRDIELELEHLMCLSLDQLGDIESCQDLLSVGLISLGLDSMSKSEKGLMELLESKNDNMDSFKTAIRTMENRKAQQDTLQVFENESMMKAYQTRSTTMLQQLPQQMHDSLNIVSLSQSVGLSDFSQSVCNELRGCISSVVREATDSIVDVTDSNLGMLQSFRPKQRQRGNCVSTGVAPAFGSSTSLSSPYFNAQSDSQSTTDVLTDKEVLSSSEWDSLIYDLPTNAT